MDIKRMKEIADKISKVKPKTEAKGIFEPTIRDLNKRARLLNEYVTPSLSSQAPRGVEPQQAPSQFPEPDQSTPEQANLNGTELNTEMQKFKNVFNNYNVTFEFENFITMGNAVIWGGTIDGQVQWVYKVAEDDEDSGVDLNFAPDFNPDEEDNKKIVDLLQNYYNEFYKYWRDNHLELNPGSRETGLT